MLSLKQSQLVTKTQKKAPKDELSLNAQLLIRGGFVDKLMAGVFTFLPLGLRVMKKIENIIREEMEAIGGQEILMPALHPKENWETTNRWKTMDDLYKLQDASGREFALGATHEEVITPLAKKFINSYKDLPLCLYQIQDKFRMELRTKSGVIRTREFIMKDAYSFHESQDDLDNYYNKQCQAYTKIFKRVGLGDKTYITFASGGSFSKYSHEFQTLTKSGEDTIYICDKCQVAVNQEIINEVADRCPECANKNLRKEKAVEVGNVFKLATKFSKPFELKYIDRNGKQKDVFMGCYGIGPARVMGAIVETSHDDKGIIWPEAVAPFIVHLLSFEQNKKATEIYNSLTKKGVETLFDDREVSSGEKLMDSDLIGLPYRVIISQKSLKNGGVEIKKRNEKASRVISVNQLIEKLQ